MASIPIDRGAVFFPTLISHAVCCCVSSALPSVLAIVARCRRGLSFKHRYVVRKELFHMVEHALVPIPCRGQLQEGQACLIRTEGRPPSLPLLFCAHGTGCILASIPPGALSCFMDGWRGGARNGWRKWETG